MKKKNFDRKKKKFNSRSKKKMNLSKKGGNDNFEFRLMDILFGKIEIDETPKELTFSSIYQYYDTQNQNMIRLLDGMRSLVQQYWDNDVDKKMILKNSLLPLNYDKDDGIFLGIKQDIKLRKLLMDTILYEALGKPFSFGEYNIFIKKYPEYRVKGEGPDLIRYQGQHRPEMFQISSKLLKKAKQMKINEMDELIEAKLNYGIKDPKTVAFFCFQYIDENRGDFDFLEPIAVISFINRMYLPVFFDSIDRKVDLRKFLTFPQRISSGFEEFNKATGSGILLRTSKDVSKFTNIHYTPTKSIRVSRFLMIFSIEEKGVEIEYYHQKIPKKEELSKKGDSFFDNFKFWDFGSK